MRLIGTALRLALLILLLTRPATALAQEPETRELRTNYFSIHYSPSDFRGAEWYAGVVDGVYEDLTDLFDHRPATPITFRLIPTIQGYVEANPMGVNPGVLAHLNMQERELGVASPRLAAAGGRLATDTIRHELTHLIAAELTRGQLPIGFQEGIAQYVERDGEGREGLIDVLRKARTDNKLLTWSRWNDRRGFYADIGIGYAESYAVMAFLADQPDGLVKFRQFAGFLAGGQRWPRALERAYGKDLAALEAEWLASLPAFLETGWQQNRLSSWDLDPALRQLTAGDYAGAEAGLQRSLDLFQALGRTARADRAREALDRAKAGRQAGEVLTRAEDRLATSDYATADAAFEQAATLYDRAGDATRAEAAREGRGVADAGRTGLDHLTRARTALDDNRFLAARAEAAEAAAHLGRAGADERRAEAESIWQTAADVQRNVGLASLGAGVLAVLAVAGLWRRRSRAVDWIAPLIAEPPAPRL